MKPLKYRYHLLKIRGIQVERENVITRLRYENEQLKREIAYLKEQLARLQWKSSNHYRTKHVHMVTKHSTLQEKIHLFKSLFRGRDDVYARRWESTTGKSGYTPVCAYEWKQPICQKPKIKCSACSHRTLLPLTDQVLADHFDGKQVIGIYPMLMDETSSFLAVDFDKENWQEDVTAFIQVCKDFEIPYNIERSRSGNGAHVWFFFKTNVKASLARKMGSVLISKAMERRYEIGMNSYDRMFPNQDTLPKAGFGNLIALPFQKQVAKKGNTLFVDDHFIPFPDQWVYLSHIRKLTEKDLTNIVTQFDGFEIREHRIHEQIPQKLTIELKNGLYIKKEKLPSSLLTRLVEIACIQNPQFYKAEKKRQSTRGLQRLIQCGEENTEYLILPRGCQHEVEALLKDFKIEIEYNDSRYEGEEIDVAFNGQLTPLQYEAVSQLSSHLNGTLSATTGFGKTVTAAALIAERQVNTLIIVNRTQLQLQWIEQLSHFLSIPVKEIGQVGGGKQKRTGKIDVVTIQSLISKQKLNSFVTQYGQIIVDECHHISAFTFERVLKQVRAKYIYGLTATPIRKDGLHPIIFMQCGPIRYKVDGKTQAKVRPFVHRLIIRHTNFRTDAEQIQKIYEQLSLDQRRNEQLFDDVLNALEEGRSPLILTERIEHLEKLKAQFNGFAKNVIILTGKLSKKEQKAELERLVSIPDDEERLILATGKYIGEGFDDSRLDTLFLAMPIAWKGTLQQYVGRLHRLHDKKQEVRVYDYVDTHVPMLTQMFKKRQAGYKAMGYVTEDEGDKTEQMRLF